jgi:hypothetical protein
MSWLKHCGCWEPLQSGIAKTSGSRADMYFAEDIPGIPKESGEPGARHDDGYVSR